MQSTFTLDTLSGAMILADVDVFDVLSADDSYAVSVVLDPAGRTELVADFRQPWPKVYSKFRSQVEELAHRLGFAILFAAQGRITAEFRFGEPSFAPSFEVPLVLRSGLLVATDAFTAPEFQQDRVPVQSGEPGIYSINGFGGSAGNVLGVFGSPEAPALTLIARRGQQSPKLQSPFVDIDTREWPREPKLGMRVLATVKEISAGVATLRLKLTPQVESGWGRLRVTSTDIAPGQSLVVTLTERTTAYWWCELAKAG